MVIQNPRSVSGGVRWKTRRGSVFPWRIGAERDVNWQRTHRMKILLIGGDPVGGYIALRCFKVQISRTDLIMKILFQRVFDMCVPFAECIGLRPEISNIVRTAQ